MHEILRINSVNADTTRTPQNIQWNNPSASGGDLQNVFQAQIWPGQYYNSLAQATVSNPITLNSLDATGKVGSVRFYVSGSYQNDEGALRDLTGNQQRRARVNLDYEARQDLTFSVSSAYDNGYNDNRIVERSLRNLPARRARGHELSRPRLPGPRHHRRRRHGPSRHRQRRRHVPLLGREHGRLDQVAPLHRRSDQPLLPGRLGHARGHVRLRQPLPRRATNYIT